MSVKVNQGQSRSLTSSNVLGIKTNFRSHAVFSGKYTYCYQRLTIT